MDDFDADKSGSVSAFQIDRATGALTLLNTRPSRGAHPCHLAVDRQGTHLLAANYTGGTLAVLPIGADGALGVPSQVVQHKGSSINTQRQTAPHAHSIDLDGDNRFAIAADLGAERLFIYRYDPRGGGLSAGLQPAIAATPGAGPRHFAFHPGGKVGFGINESNMTLTSFKYDADKGTLTEIETLPTIPKDAKPGSVDGGGHRASERQVGVRLEPRPRHHRRLRVWRHRALPTLVEIESTRGKTPRNFTIDPTGQWLIAANQATNTPAVFRISDKNGALAPVGPLVNVGSPVSVVFLR